MENVDVCGIHSCGSDRRLLWGCQRPTLPDIEMSADPNSPNYGWMA